MMQDYAIVIEPHLVKNFWKGRGHNYPVAVVEHTMQGTLENTYRYFDGLEGDFYVSAHYGIARDGRVWQFVHEEDTAWANGVLQKPDLSLDWLKNIVDHKLNANVLTISIAYEGKNSEPLTEAQYEAALALHSQILRRWDIPADEKHLVGHNRLDSVERQANPGPHFPFQRLLNDLNSKEIFRSEIFAATPTPPEPAEIPEDFEPFNLPEIPEEADFGDDPTFVPVKGQTGLLGSMAATQALDLNLHEDIESIADTAPIPTSNQADPSTEDVGYNINWASLGGGIVMVELANVRIRPSFEPTSILRTASRGSRLHFDGYSEGPEVQGQTRWYHIARDDGGGWINSALVQLDKPQ